MLVGSKAFGGLNRRLKEKTAESRWFETTGQAPFGRAKAAYWKIKTKGKRWLDRNFSCQARFEFFDHTRKGTDVVKYTLYRVLQLVPVWLLLSIFVFAIMHALPGAAIDALVPPDAASNPETRAALEKDLGLDQPVYVQYVRWLGRIVLHGDFGKSITTRRTISVE